MAIFANPVVGLIAGLIGLGFVIYDISVAVYESNRPPIAQLAESTYLVALEKSEIEYNGDSIKAIDLYSNPEEISDDKDGEPVHTFMGRIRNIANIALTESGSDVFKWGHLNWRAIIPLYEMGFPVEKIKDFVKLPTTTTEYLRRVNHHGAPSKGYMTPSVENVHEYFNYCLENPDEKVGEYVNEKGIKVDRTRKDISRELRDGVFLPKKGNEEDITITDEHGNIHVISFDHEYFYTQNPPNNGNDWEEFKRISFSKDNIGKPKR